MADVLAKRCIAAPIELDRLRRVYDAWPREASDVQDRLRQLDSIGFDTFGNDGLKPRNTTRLSCSVLSDLRPDGIRNVRVRLCDLSELGFMAECKETVPLGGTVSIDLPGLGATHARVRWSMGGRIGGRFMQPIDVDACRTAIAEVTRTT